MDECDHGSDPATCPVCRRAAGKDKPAPVERTAIFTANYDGFCSGCKLPIEVGQPIFAIKDPHLSFTPYYHEWCGS